MLVSRALFEAVNEFYRCGWSIDCQGVNSADGATGTPGDLTIRRGEEIVKAIEVTERPIGVTRVETTFHTKIATNAVRDYLFIYTSAVPDEGVYDVAKIYFAQGYDVNFIKLTNLAAAVFAAGDASMRRMFMDRMLGCCGREMSPRRLRPRGTMRFRLCLGPEKGLRTALSGGAETLHILGSFNDRLRNRLCQAAGDGVSDLPVD